MRLERKGYEVVIVRDGLEGLQAIKTVSPDIVLLDVGLPSMDGYQVAKESKSDPEIAHIPIIMLTANALSEDREKAIRAGADDYEPKPVIMENLLKKIEALTHRS